MTKGIPEEFRVEGQTITLPADLSHIPFMRRKALTHQLGAAYPGPVVRFITGIVWGLLGSAFLLFIGLFLWPALFAIPLMLLWGLGVAFGLIDANRKDRDKLHATLRDLYRDGYLSGETAVRSS